MCFYLCGTTSSVSSVQSVPALKRFESAVAKFKPAIPSNSGRTDSGGAGKLQLQGEGRVGRVKLAVTCMLNSSFSGIPPRPPQIDDDDYKL